MTCLSDFFGSGSDFGSDLGSLAGSDCVSGSGSDFGSLVLSGSGSLAVVGSDFGSDLGSEVVAGSDSGSLVLSGSGSLTVVGSAVVGSGSAAAVDSSTAAIFLFLSKYLHKMNGRGMVNCRRKGRE